MTKEHLITSNLEMRFEDARNTRGAALIPLAVNYCQQDPKKGNAAPSKVGGIYFFTASPSHSDDWSANPKERGRTRTLNDVCRHNKRQ